MWCGGISNRQAQSYGVAGFGFRKRTCTEMSNYLHRPFKAMSKTIICSKNSKKQRFLRRWPEKYLHQIGRWVLAKPLVKVARKMLDLVKTNAVSSRLNRVYFFCFQHAAGGIKPYLVHILAGC